ncbi:type II secretion system F family protein [Demequina sp. NBRC 110051]|uniref:type II secretion system F family protein n=1 Tax=Demequina sp. NBRC 110051 TaxID=1570340 RepID=UPI00117F7A6A|nr:type II secretion system F family protein [Demequina sp. NBRC 110051]
MRWRRKRARVSPPAPTRALANAVALLESGLPPAQAWSLAGLPVADDGRPTVPGADAVVTRAVAASATLADEGGMPLAAVLRRVLAVLHAREEAADAREAALAGPRMSARVLGWLPLAGLGLAAALDPGALRLVALTPLGWVLLVGAGLLTWVGRRWTRALLSRAEPPAEDVPTPLVLALVDAVLAAGIDVPGTLTRIGIVLGGADGAALVETGQRLASGAPWDEAWEAPDADGMADTVRQALQAAHLAGASAGPALAAAIDQAVREDKRAGQKAAAELSVTLALPLTLCLLPAFILVGVVPLIAAVIASVDLGAVI